LKGGDLIERDRTAICNIISEMLDGPVWKIPKRVNAAYTRLEQYVEGERARAIGWAHADACITLDRGDDPRSSNVPEMLTRAQVDLAT